MTDRRFAFGLIFDVKNPKEVGRDPFAARRLAGNRETSARRRYGGTRIPSQRKDTARTSAPDRLWERVIRKGGQPWSISVKSRIERKLQRDQSDRSTPVLHRKYPVLRERWSEAVRKDGNLADSPARV